MTRKRSASTRNDSIDIPSESVDEVKELRPSGFRRGWSIYYKVLLPFFLLATVFYLLFRSNSTYDDPRKLSKFCTSSFLGKPLVQYVLMIDAGSSGSRIHVYRFNYCKDTPEVEDEIFKQKQPGLSGYLNDPEAAAKSLDPLFEEAIKAVPEDMHKCTPVAVKATAGLRLHKEKSDAILKAVRKRLEEHYNFPLVPSDPVSIMDGKDEGVFAWITVNYLLGKLNSNAPEYSSVATIDLGGGSVQIVFEPIFQGSDSLEKGDHVYSLAFAGRTHQLYQHSYLGFGLNEARKAAKELAIERWLQSGQAFKVNVPFSCFTLGSIEEFIYNQVTYVLEGVDTSEEACSELLRAIFHKDEPCHLEPCSFKGVYQPKLSETFKTNDIYAFSFFYDRTYPFGLRDKFRVKDIQGLAQHVCSGNFAHFKSIPGALEELKTKHHRCLDITYLHTLLTTGFDLEPNRWLLSAKKINDLETGWCLGASIAVLDEKNYCPATPFQ